MILGTNVSFKTHLIGLGWDDLHYDPKVKGLVTAVRGPQMKKHMKLNHKITASMSRQIGYATRGTISHWSRKQAVKFVADMVAGIEVLSSKLDLPEVIHLNFKRFNESDTYGDCTPHKSCGKMHACTIRINMAAWPLPDIGNFMETIAHELVHAEQFNQGRLETTIMADKNFNLVHTKKWEGVAWKSKGATYNSYRNLPWEKEAFDRQAQLAIDALTSIGYKVE